MPDLVHSLQGYDLGHLHIVSQLWGVALRSTDRVAAIDELAGALLKGHLSGEVIASVGPDAQAALTALAQAGGRIPWVTFARRFGDVREIGAGKRDREKPYLNPTSAAEVLFYRALLARAFFDTEKGPQEFAYLPDEWMAMMLQGGSGRWTGSAAPLGRQATTVERAHPVPANDRILDEATTLLAARRIGLASSPDPFLQSLLNQAGILKKNEIQADKTRLFLEAQRGDSLKMLVDEWRASEQHNDLRMIPGLVCEGAWNNEPAAARRFVLGLLDTIPAGTWWSLSTFTADIKSKYPDFQRPAGDYDSWFIKSALDGHYLRGFAAWDEVDGALIRYIITKAMHRLGILDLATRADTQEITAFRIPPSPNERSRGTQTEKGKLHLASQGSIVAPRTAPRAVRYQLARFCESDAEGPDEYRYHLTPQSLRRAADQGLKVEHLLALLAKHADAGIPAAMTKALKRWESNGTEVRAETQVVLRVSRPEMLAELRKSRAARFLGEPLGPTAVVIKGGAHARVIAALAELGLLAEDNTVTTGGEPAPSPAPAKGRPAK